MPRDVASLRAGRCGTGPLNECPVDVARQIALTGNQLAVPTATSGPNQVGHARAYGGLVLYSVYSGYVGGSETLHVLDPVNR